MESHATTLSVSSALLHLWKSQIVLGIASLLLSIAPVARGAGVTIITHGLNGNADGWVTGMADQIPNHHNFAGSNHTFYKLYFYYSGGSYYLTWTRLAGSQPSATDSGEIVVALDWSQLADGNSFNTYQVAGAVSSALQNTNFISELNGHALCELPVHLIGHSRGGSLMSELSLRLGTNGVAATRHNEASGFDHKSACRKDLHEFADGQHFGFGFGQRRRGAS